MRALIGMTVCNEVVWTIWEMCSHSSTCATAVAVAIVQAQAGVPQLRIHVRNARPCRNSPARKPGWKRLAPEMVIAHTRMLTHTHTHAYIHAHATHAHTGSCTRTHSVTHTTHVCTHTNAHACAKHRPRAFQPTVHQIRSHHLASTSDLSVGRVPCLFIARWQLKAAVRIHYTTLAVATGVRHASAQLIVLIWRAGPGQRKISVGVRLVGVRVYRQASGGCGR
jgi:hypothetical protein